LLHRGVRSRDQAGRCLRRGDHRGGEERKHGDVWVRGRRLRDPVAVPENCQDSRLSASNDNETLLAGR
jgi:hypothetical protein